MTSSNSGQWTRGRELFEGENFLAAVVDANGARHESRERVLALGLTRTICRRKHFLNSLQKVEISRIPKIG